MQKEEKIIDLYSRFVETIISQKLKMFLLNNGFVSIAIYGYGKIGQSLHDYLLNNGFKISYIIDMNESIPKQINNVEHYGSSDKYPKTDAVIITVAINGESVQDYLAGKVECPIFLFEDLI